MRVIIGFIFCSLFWSCSPSFIIEPLGNGESKIYGSLGGPLVEEYALQPIPAPILALGYAKGLENKLTFHNTWYLSSMTYGVLQTELGVLKGLKDYDSKSPIVPGISTDLRLNVATDFFESELKIWPQIDFNTYWKLSNSESIFYFGIENWFEMYDQLREDGPGEAKWKILPHIGLQIDVKQSQLLFELKYLSPYLHTEFPVDYYIPKGSRVLGVYLGWSKSF